jgi:KamA family protein
MSAIIKAPDSSQLLEQRIDVFENVEMAYPVKIPHRLLNRIRNGAYSTDAARQFLPDPLELSGISKFNFDPCNEETYKVNPALIHMNRDSAALIITNQCATHCRYCFRKDFVGNQSTAISAQDISKAISYIESTTSISDVLITGGDPLALPNRKLIPILEKISEINSVKSIRIHSRLPAFVPSRVNEELLSCLSRSRKYWLYLHLNHPDDLGDVDFDACIAKIQRCGIPILNQSVILHGVNDQVETIKALMMACYERRIIPYNLYVFNPVKGADHFQVESRKIENIFVALTTMPGPAQPTLVIVGRDNKKQRFVFSGEDSLISLREALTKMEILSRP